MFSIAVRKRPDKGTIKENGFSLPSSSRGQSVGHAVEVTERNRSLGVGGGTVPTVREYIEKAKRRYLRS